MSGWLGIVLLLSGLRFEGGQGFDLERNDFIMKLLANMACFGSLVWLITRGSLTARLGSLGVLLALRLAAGSPGWPQWINDHPRSIWLFEPRYLDNLFIVIPGTIVGDMIVSWTKRGESAQEASWSPVRLGVAIGLLIAIVVVALAGLKTRHVLATTILVSVLCALGVKLLRNPLGATEKLVRSLYTWGSIGCYWDCSLSRTRAESRRTTPP